MTKVMTVGWGRVACDGQIIPLSISETADVHQDCWATSPKDGVEGKKKYLLGKK